MFDALYEEANRVPAFADRPLGSGVKGPPRHPLKIKMLAWLRHIATGADGHLLEEVARISPECLRVFFAAFAEWMATVQFPLWVRPPEGEELDKAMEVYRRLGFPGACASADGVHIAWDSCPYTQRFLFEGKEQFPTVAFNVTNLHSR
jgi:hypothetical protein